MTPFTNPTDQSCVPKSVRSAMIEELIGTSFRYTKEEATDDLAGNPSPFSRINRLPHPTHSKADSITHISD
jgi:hypothetical protein